MIVVVIVLGRLRGGLVVRLGVCDGGSGTYVLVNSSCAYVYVFVMVICVLLLSRSVSR